MRQLLNDPDFVTQFYKKAINEDSDFYKIEQLHFLKIDKTTIADYGNCIIALFKYLTPTSANQDRPAIIFNLENGEVTIWSFNSLTVNNEMIDLDFKVRGNKHTLYTAKYNTDIKKFISNCYKIVTTE